jgi:hypothetical protein
VLTAPPGLTIPLAALLAVLAVAAAVMAKRGAAGALRRAGRLGVHSPPAIASEDAFALANRVAAPVAAGASIVAGVLALLVLVLPLPTAGTVSIWLLGLVGSMVLLVLAGVLGDRAARQVPIPARRPGSAAGAGCSGCACGGGGCAGLTRTDPAAAAGQA